MAFKRGRHGEVLWLVECCVTADLICMWQVIFLAFVQNHGRYGERVAGPWYFEWGPCHLILKALED